MEVVPKEVKEVTGFHTAFLDIEYAGFNKAKHPLIEIGLILADPSGNYVDRWSSMILPYTLPGGVEPEYTPEAEAVHMITMEDILKDGCTAQDVAQSFVYILKKANVNHIVGHCVKGDMTRLRAFCEQFGHVIPEIATTCSMAQAKKKFKLPNYQLQTIREHLGIPQANKHRALSDSYVLFEAWPRLR